MLHRHMIGTRALDLLSIHHRKAHNCHKATVFACFFF